MMNIIKERNDKFLALKKYLLLMAEEKGQVLVVVLATTAKPGDQNIANLRYVFADPYFIFQVINPTVPDNIANDPVASENYIMRQALQFASEGPYLHGNTGLPNRPSYSWKDLPCLIVKDSSVSNLTPAGTSFPASGSLYIGGISNRIATARRLAPNADLVYLTTWLDSCEKYRSVAKGQAIDRGSSLKWTVRPNSTQAIMYTPATRDFIINELIKSNASLNTMLNNLVASNRLFAVTFVPNLIDFDVNLATANSDFVKLNKCGPVSADNGNTSSAASIIWFLIIVALILLLAWALLSIGPQYVRLGPGAIPPKK